MYGADGARASRGIAIAVANGYAACVSGLAAALSGLLADVSQDATIDVENVAIDKVGGVRG